MRVAIADDLLLFRDGLASLLRQAGIDVIAEASCGAELIALIAQEPPDVAIVDIRMPPTHTNEGLAAARELRAMYPRLGILVLSLYVETSYAVEVMDIAESYAGYLIKDRVNNIEELTSALRRISAGELVLDPLVVQRLLRRSRSIDPIARLTEREREVMQLVAEGYSNQSIAAKLYIQLKTVEHHIGSIFDCLGLETSADSNRRVRAVLAWLRRDA